MMVNPAQQNNHQLDCLPIAVQDSFDIIPPDPV